ncbi:MAG: hypothetical protein K2N77_12015, partial [Lachnospiraceae bacterium]|nr:hypothetical protein [Lachnospiraceae bacterium]
IYTAIMFLSAVCMIFGGWFLTARLLRQREVRFLGSTGKVAVQSGEIGLFADDILSSVQDSEPEEQEEFQGQKISEYVRALVLAVWEYGGKELPHEPMAGQMNMKQAIDAGKKWVENMAQIGVYTDELSGCDFDATKAELCTIDTPIRMSMDESMYSYWKIWFIKDGVSVELTIHAASGEVWKAKISVEQGKEKDNYVPVYDMGYLLQYAFPFMGSGINKEWTEAYDLEGDMQSVNVVRVESKAVYAEASQSFIQSGGRPDRSILEFELYMKEN